MVMKTTTMLTKEEFIAFFGQKKTPNPSVVKKMLKKMPELSEVEVKAIGYYLGASNLGCVFGSNEKEFLRRNGNKLETFCRHIRPLLDGMCEGNDEAYYGIMEEVNEWVNRAQKNDPYSIYTWHHDRLEVGQFPSHFA
jgi:hypothetical protein